MEDYLQTIIVGIAQDIFIEFHRLLFVTTEEVNFDSHYTYLLHPSHLLLAGDGIVHNLTWSLWSIILETIRIIPEHQTNLLALGILSQLLNVVTTDALVPPVVYEDSLIALSRSNIG